MALPPPPPPPFAVPSSGITTLFTSDPNVGPGSYAIQYAFGINTAASSLWFHYGVGPNEWIKIGDGAGSSGTTVQVILYTVTGSEPDLSEIVVALSTPITDPYGVVASCQGCQKIVALDIPNDLKTSTQFTAIATDDFQADDKIVFFVAPIT